MKKLLIIKNLKWVFILSILFSLSSCLDDLNIAPKDDDQALSESFFATNPNSYKQFLAKIYAGFVVTGQEGPAGQSDLGSSVDEGFSQYLRGYWQCQELTTDEAMIAWGESDNKTIKDLNFNTWDKDNVFTEAFFARVFFQVGLCNEFLRETTPEKLTSRGVSDDLKTQITKFRAEVRFLRALTYFHGIDIFGNLPFMTDADPLGIKPPMQTREFIFNYLITELDAIDADLVAPKANEYGRADKAAAWMLKAKLLINSKVYTTKDRNADALVALNKVLTSGYIIIADRNKLFQADNNTNGAQNEIIFPLVSDGIKSQTWGGMTYLVHGSCDNAVGLLLGVDSGWKGYRIRKEFAETVGTSDARVTYVQGNTDPASITNPTVDTNQDAFVQGKKLTKFTNVRSDGAKATSATFPDTDFPMFRMGDAYLMYAELAANGVGDKSIAKDYINNLRKRANINAPTITASEVTPDLVLNERAKELYWEGYRRQDLIRFGKYLSGYNWEWKGGVKAGGTLPDFRLLFAIPANELRSNSNLSQNPGF
ncbi:RagB/SusD family nutrient uptake outer membrane protein [Flavobacterium cellulosilyticum]|uniref:RagB/SusD family nutrient uptake outer membrane protein n=1 Tax=Flavobacterium cellulosilyticum TaxID=2541731 RepID=A0A4R5CGG3_9FLAO|nr:RagB/SusD family nutrient uptake outer membrane protein [Flavobacterium cellulosilyticum]TDD99248.1 RagB/SusD family nutrient uptake outer membrane protein [Flavobacterium cellulosilyticum]